MAVDNGLPLNHLPPLCPREAAALTLKSRRAWRLRHVGQLETSAEWSLAGDDRY